MEVIVFMALFMKEKRLRGVSLNVDLKTDESKLLAELEKAGISRNAFVEEVAANALKFRDEEEQRRASSLNLKGDDREVAICRNYQNLQRQSTWLFIRHSANDWYLSGILFD
jgi:hypothetical protein